MFPGPAHRLGRVDPWMMSGGRVMQRDERLALAVADVHGLPTATVRPIVGAGWTNHVVVLGSPAPAYVVRYALDPADDARVGLETWLLPRVAAHGVPGPKLVASGEIEGIPYLVQEFVTGGRGPDRASPGLWHILGRYASAMRTVALGPDAPDLLFTRFGRDLPAAWRDHLAYSLDQLTDDDPLLRLGVYKIGQQQAIHAVVAALAEVPLTHGLGHGDLTLANVLVPDGRPPVVLDWGAAAAGPSPWHDLVLLHRNRVRDRVVSSCVDAFIDGCGLPLAQAKATVTDLTLLGDLDLVRWARERAPHRLAELVEAARRTVGRTTDRFG